VADRSYALIKDNAPEVFIFLTHDGATRDEAASTVTVTTGQWYFIVGRFIPSTEEAIFVNGAWDTNVVGVNASIQNTASAFRIFDQSDNSSRLNGRVSLAFLCATALSDSIVSALFHQTRAMFNV
jgi:hypothetical protein